MLRRRLLLRSQPVVLAAVTTLALLVSGCGGLSPAGLSSRAVTRVEEWLGGFGAELRVVYTQGGFAYVRGVGDDESHKLWPQRVRGLSASANGFVALQPEGRPIEPGDVIVVSAADPGKAVLHVPNAGYSAVVDHPGRYVGYVQRLEEYTEQELRAILDRVWRLQGFYLQPLRDATPGEHAEVLTAARRAAEAVATGADVADVATSACSGSPCRARPYPTDRHYGFGAADFDSVHWAAGPDVARRLEGAAPESIVGPFRTELGYHVIKVVRHGVPEIEDRPPPKRTAVVTRAVSGGGANRLTVDTACSLSQEPHYGFAIIRRDFPRDYLDFGGETREWFGPVLDPRSGRTSQAGSIHPLAEGVVLEAISNADSKLVWRRGFEHPRRPLTGDAQWVWDYAVAPGGRAVAMCVQEQRRRGEKRLRLFSIRVWSVADNSLRTVASTPAAERGAAQSFLHVTWVGPERRLVFERSYPDHSRELWALDPSSQQPAALLATGRFPVWYDRQAARLLFTRRIQGRREIWRVGLDGAHLRRVDDLPRTGTLVHVSELAPGARRTLALTIVAAAWVALVAGMFWALLKLRASRRHRTSAHGSG